MRAMLMGGVADANVPRLLTRTTIGASCAQDERWLQRLLFEHPELVPIDTIDARAQGFVPICRELSIPKMGSAVFLDLLGVTPAGRLVLIECKLWRNPEARREVVAQILEYASLLRRWSYADLATRLKTTLGSTAPNALFDLVRKKAPDLDEARFVDAVSQSLHTGDFVLIVAGDGIRSDLQAVADHLNDVSGSMSRLALLEIQLWQDSSGAMVLLPIVPFRTEVVQRRVIVDTAGIPVLLSTGADATEAGPPAFTRGRSDQLEVNRTFWQQFIDTAHFDHADQPPPRHGGNNWVRLPLPPPAGWLTVYRSIEEIGLSLRLRDETGRALFDRLEMDAEALDAEIGATLSFAVSNREPFEGLASTTVSRSNPDMTDEDQLRWLVTISNRLISALRLRLALDGDR